MKSACTLRQRRISENCAWLSKALLPKRLVSTTTSPGRQSPKMRVLRDDTLFKYTSGRWIYNEQLRMTERQRVFDVVALQRLAASAVSRKFEDIHLIRKIGEGAANRAFVIQFHDGFKLVARIPYPVTEPRQLVVASEVATMVFLRMNGIPVPEIYGYSNTADNSAKTEYIFMEFSPGRNLGTVWSSMDEHDRRRLTTSLVGIEARMFNIRLPASGSVYFPRDLSLNVEKVAIDSHDCGDSELFCVGPSTSLHLWYGRRKDLRIGRGPYNDSEAVLKASAEKELQYLERYGRPLFPFDRMRRETFGLEKQSHLTHIDSLEKYLQIHKHLTPQGSRSLLQPTIRHPDLRPSNIFVSDNYEITSLIDWQHSEILPMFLQSGIPDEFNNSSDQVSRSLETPQLPESLSSLSEDEKIEQLELFCKRQLHHVYMTATAENNPSHFRALTHPLSIGRRKIYNLSGAPWQGDNIPLRSSLIFLKQHWDQIAARPDLPCPITFTEEEEHECLRLDELEREAVLQLEASNDMLGLGPEGWVSCENYEAAKEAIARMKTICLEQAESETDRIAIRDHWVYDDMDEDEYL